MLPLLDRIVRTWAEFGSATHDAAPGDVFILPSDAAIVMRPDSVREPVSGGRYQVPPIAGVYEARTETGRVTSGFAVNPPAAESDLRAISKDRLDVVLDGWTVRTPDSADAWTRDIYRQRLGRELGRPLLVALLLLLMLEALIAASGGFRRRAFAGTSPDHVPDNRGVTRTAGVERETV